MPQNELAGSITYRQKQCLKQLVEKTSDHDVSWFDDLKHGRIDYDDVSAAQASQFIGELTLDDDDEINEPANEGAGDTPSKRPPGPVTSKQLDLIRKLMDDKDLVVEGYIDAEHVYSRLTTSTASKLIEAVN